MQAKLGEVFSRVQEAVDEFEPAVDTSAPSYESDALEPAVDTSAAANEAADVEPAEPDAVVAQDVTRRESYGGVMDEMKLIAQALKEAGVEA